MARRGLGRGLDALIGRMEPAAGGAAPAAPRASSPGEERAPSAAGKPTEIPLQEVDPSPWQPRQAFDDDRLQALADSIREQGLIQPVVVRRRGERYELVAGERRWRAMQRLGQATIAAVIMDASDARMRELALVENLQRDDLNAVEVGVAYQALQTELGLTHEQIAARVGVSRAQVTNMLRLLDLPEEVKGLLCADRLSAGHARALLGLPDGLSQIRLARRIAEEGLTVRAVEALVAGKAGGKTHRSEARTAEVRDPQLRDVEERLSQHLGTKVRLIDRHGQGTIVIEYYSPDDAARILERMNLPDELA